MDIVCTYLGTYICRYTCMYSRSEVLSGWRRKSWDTDVMTHPTFGHPTVSFKVCDNNDNDCTRSALLLRTISGRYLHRKHGRLVRI